MVQHGNRFIARLFDDGAGLRLSSVMLTERLANNCSMIYSKMSAK